MAKIQNNGTYESYFSPTNDLVVTLVSVFLPMYQKLIEKQDKVSRHDFKSNIQIAGEKAYALAHYLLADIPGPSSVEDIVFLERVRNQWSSAAIDADKLLKLNYKKAKWLKNIVVQSLHARQFALPKIFGEKYSASVSNQLAQELLQKYGSNIKPIAFEDYPQYVANTLARDTQVVL